MALTGGLEILRSSALHRLPLQVEPACCRAPSRRARPGSTLIAPRSSAPPVHRAPPDGHGATISAADREPTVFSETLRETFVQAARTVMDFLVSEYGFTETALRLPHDESSAYAFCSITYSKPVAGDTLSVELSTAPFRLETDLELSIRDRSGQTGRMSIRDLWRIEGLGNEFPERTVDLYQAAHDPARLQREFTRLTSVLRACGQRFFARDSSLWRDLAEHRRRQAEERRQEEEKDRLDRVSKQAAEAFKASRWEDATRLLESLGPRATPLDRKRLLYAQKRLSRQ